MSSPPGIQGRLPWLSIIRPFSSAGRKTEKDELSSANRPFGPFFGRLTAIIVQIVTPTLSANPAWLVFPETLIQPHVCSGAITKPAGRCNLHNPYDMFDPHHDCRCSQGGQHGDSFHKRIHQTRFRRNLPIASSRPRLPSRAFGKV